MLAVLLWQYRDELPSLRGGIPYDIYIPSPSLADRPQAETKVPYNHEYYKIVFDQSRMICHYVAKWIEHGTWWTGEM